VLERESDLLNYGHNPAVPSCSHVLADCQCSLSVGLVYDELAATCKATKYRETAAQ